MDFLGEECPVTDEADGFCHTDDLFSSGNSFFGNFGFPGNQTNQPERFVSLFVDQVAFPVHLADAGLANNTFTTFVERGEEGVGTINTDVTIFFV